MGNPWIWPPIVGANVAGLPVNVNEWRPDQPTAQSTVWDDEMQGSIIDPKWTEWDPGNVGTFSMNTERRQLQCVSSGLNERVCGLYQSAPVATPYAIYAKVGLNTDRVPTDNTWMGVGILIANNIVANPATSTFRAIGLVTYPGGNQGLHGAAWNWANYGALTANTQTFTAGIYSRVRMNGTALRGDVSPDGQAWQSVYSETLPFTPGQIGLFTFTYGNTLARTITSYVTFFRVFTGPNAALYNGTEIGRSVNL